MHCSNCGQTLNTDAKFCSRCGAKIQNGILNERQYKKHEQASVICPKCKLDDRIEKVTSIVKSHTRTREHTEWLTGYYTDKNGKEQSYSYPRSYDVVEATDLAKRLTPPQPPQVKSFSSCLLILGGVLLFFSILTIVFALEFGVIKSNEWSLIGELIPVLIPLGLGVLVFVAKRAHDKRETERVAREILLWEDAIKKWNRLYYCYRDDIVFDSDDLTNSCQPEDIIEFCYQQNR